MVYSNYSGNRANMLYRITVMVTVLFGIVGCTDQVLYSNLSEREANEMIALLYKKGISASKSSGSDHTYSISTERDRFSHAIELLRSQGYPRNHFESLGEVFKKEGFVSSPLEERARLNYAQSQELARTIESIDGVVLARVHLALPKENDLTETSKPSSASVFLKHRRGIDLSGRESQIKALIVNSIEGLPYENVTVAMFTTEPIPAFNDNAHIDNDLLVSQATQIYLIIALTIMVVVLVIVSVWLWLKHAKHPPQYELAKTHK
jgi:type III secretion protein J